MELWWNPGGTLRQGRPVPPRSLSGLRPQSFSCGEKSRRDRLPSGKPPLNHPDEKGPKDTPLARRPCPPSLALSSPGSSTASRAQPLDPSRRCPMETRWFCLGGRSLFFGVRFQGPNEHRPLPDLAYLSKRCCPCGASFPFKPTSYLTFFFPGSQVSGRIGRIGGGVFVRALGSHRRVRGEVQGLANASVQATIDIYNKRGAQGQ